MTAISVNKVILVGNLGANPETRFTPSGTQVTSACVATDEYWTDRNGKSNCRTEWHCLVMWRHIAKIASKYLRKGSKVRVEGRLSTRHWDDKVGRRQCVTEVVVTDLEFVDDAEGPSGLDMKYAKKGQFRALFRRRREKSYILHFGLKKHCIR